MFLIIKCSSDIKKGDVLEFDSINQMWIKSTSGASVISVAREDANIREIDGVDVHVVASIFAGIAYAKASRDISSQGGRLGVENGAVYIIDQSDSRCVVLPADINVTSRSIDSLVRVNIR